MKRKLLEIMALMLVGLPLIAGNVDFKFSGPAGQGDWIWWSRLTGTTNMVMGSNGISYLHCATGAAVITNATISQQTGAVTATAVVTPQAPGAQTPTITVSVQGTTGYAAGVAVTNAAGATLVWITNVTATCSALPNFATNATAAVTIVGGGAVVTNVTLSNP